MFAGPEPVRSGLQCCTVASIVLDGRRVAHDVRGQIIGAGHIITLLGSDRDELSQPPGTSSWYPKAKAPGRNMHVLSDLYFSIVSIV